MTTGELILELQKLSPEIKVVVRGYEEGYNDVQLLKPVKLVKKIDAKWYYGEYADDDTKDAIDAFELYGENKNE